MRDFKSVSYTILTSATLSSSIIYSSFGEQLPIQVTQLIMK